MRKVIAAINMTLDGFCDHTAVIADDELHDHYSKLLKSAGVILYGRTTYELMEYWLAVLENPTGDQSTDEFAAAIDKVPKIVFSNTLKNDNPVTDPINARWESARLARRSLEEEVAALRPEAGKDIFVGSPGLISELTRLNLIDEYQLCVHPVIAGSGLPLFKNITDRIALKLLETKTFGSGAVVFYYESVKND